MNLTRTICLTFAVAAVALIAHHAPAGQQAGVGGGLYGQPAERVDIEFPGGTVPEFVDAVHRAFDDVNIVMQGPVERFTMPAMHLRNTRAVEAITLMSQAAAPAEEHAGSLQVNPMGGQTWLVRGVGPGRPYALPTGTKTFAIADILHVFEPEDVLTSVETALELGGGEPAAQLRLHPATGLLITHGTTLQLDTVEGVVNQLRIAAIDKESAPMADQDEMLRSQQTQIHNLQAEIERLQERLRGAQRLYEELQEELRRLQG